MSTSSGHKRTPPAEVRAARIAAVAAILAALLSGASGIFTLVTSSNEIAAEDERSETEFLRDRRQAAYVDFLVDMRTAQRAIENIKGLLQGPADNPAVTPGDAESVREALEPNQYTEFLTLRQQANDALNPLHESSSAVAIVGSDGATEAAGDARYRFVYTVATLDLDVSASDLLIGLTNEEGSLLRAQGRFVQAAIKDVQGE